MAGRFITFEGIEGCGKSTQIEFLDTALRARGHETLLSREPGGPPIGEAIRKILLNKKFKEMRPKTELLLYAANRSQHVEEVIQPALKEGKIVLVDRYADSTAAYQGAARAIDPKTLELVHQIATNNFQPDKTFLLDVTVEEGMNRIRKRKQLDRFEEEEDFFHKKVREGYLGMAKKDPKRFCIVDGTKTIETIHQIILKETLGVL